MLDGLVNIAQPQFAILLVPTESASVQTLVTVLELTILELCAKPLFVNPSAKMELCALLLVPATVPQLVLDGVALDVKLLTAAQIHAKTRECAQPLANATVLILDIKDLLAKQMKMNAKDLTAHVIKDSLVSTKLDLTDALEPVHLD